MTDSAPGANPSAAGCLTPRFPLLNIRRVTTVPRKPPLRVLLSFERAQDSGDPYAFRFEPQDYTLPTVGGGSPSARFDWTTAVLADLKAIREPGREPVVLQRMGEAIPYAPFCRSGILGAGASPPATK